MTKINMKIAQNFNVEAAVEKAIALIENEKLTPVKIAETGNLYNAALASKYLELTNFAKLKTNGKNLSSEQQSEIKEKLTAYAKTKECIDARELFVMSALD